MAFEFDPKKAAANLRKHGVSLADAEPVFYDDQALTREDSDANDEARFVTVGTDAMGRILTVCWTERSHAIRLISARLSTQAERKVYES
ncbi:MAG: BrnT family toxin [Thiobacillus sp.]|nr:BrnT family toxin [Thiobacillus sp.]